LGDGVGAAVCSGTDWVTLIVGGVRGAAVRVLSLIGCTLPPADANTTSTTAATPRTRAAATASTLRRVGCIREE
jgi:hypothetical protein